jgi:hypothetical protein
MTIFTPRGWTPGLIQQRFASTTPTSYNADSGTIDCVIGRGSPVRRFSGTEVLRIAPDAVIIDRLVAGGIPLLDSHDALGKVTRVWFSGGALMGQLSFKATAEGRKAEGMVKRGEIIAISAGYTVRDWEISDDDGNVIDPEKTQLRWDDSDLTSDEIGIARSELGYRAS